MELFITITIFVSVLLVVLTMVGVLRRRLEVEQSLAAAELGLGSTRRTDRAGLDQRLGSGHEYVENFFDVARNRSPNDLEFRLIRAGFFSRRAPPVFQLVRLAAAVLAFVLVWYGVRMLAPEQPEVLALLMGAIFSGLIFIACSAVVDHLAKKREIAYRKLFPDFMDMMIVCLDAGLSVEAALDRVSREFLHTVPDFGTHLSVIGVEVRTGRALHLALRNFAERVNVEEAKILAVLFRQSEELGTSITQTLRTYSEEMRQTRLIKAEEKANQLPVKMLFPMALFIFPASLIVVVAPVLISLIQMLTRMTPG